ncbi:MAG: formate dehydrogenase [Anaerolineae bacterium]
MPVNAMLEVKGDVLATLSQLMRDLLEKGIVDALLVPQVMPSGDNVVQTLVRDPTKLEGVDLIAPVLPVNSAKLVADLTVTDFEGKLAAVLRSCEIRALIELVKLQQARLDNVVIVGLDCLGTYEVIDYAERSTAEGKGAGMFAELKRRVEEGSPLTDLPLRAACRMCDRPFPERADLAIGFVGLDAEKAIFVSAEDELAERLGLPAAEVPAGRKEVMDRIVTERAAERDRAFAEFRETVVDMPTLLAQFSTCIRCYNCMVACPICYCKECIFCTATFDHPPARYRRWAERKGSIRMPTDTLLFHLTRLNHMATSCVGCGMCESACPSHLPVATIFRAVGQKVQALFDYIPGRSLEEEIPLATFREDELGDLGERR